MLDVLLPLRNRLLFPSQRVWILFVASISFLFAASVYLIGFHHTQIATVDVTGIVHQFIQSQRKLNLPPKALEARVKRFGHQLEDTLKSIAKERHAILMPQEAVIAGAMDLTSVVKERLQANQGMGDALW